jgi:hypothetical protein
MPTPIEAYRKGYEKGRSDTAGGRAAEMTMGMLRDDPGGHFQKGYTDGAAGNAFNPPSIMAPKRFQTDRLIPKFSDNPFGWFLGILIVIELWVLWQLIKAPFQLIGSITRSEKPSASVISKNAILAVLAVTLVWLVPRAGDMRGLGTSSSYSTRSSVSLPTVGRSPDGDFVIQFPSAVGTFLAQNPSVAPASINDLGLSQSEKRRYITESLEPYIRDGTMLTPYVAIADFNRDGKQDFAVAFRSRQQINSMGWREWWIVVFHGQGDGSFEPLVVSQERAGTLNGLVYDAAANRLEFAIFGVAAGSFQWTGTAYDVRHIVGD